MGFSTIPPCLVATLFILAHAAAGSGNFAVKSTPKVSVSRGHTVTLPCWLSSAQRLEVLDVLWYYKNNVDLSLIRFKDKKVSSPPSYAGRVSFGSREAASGGLAFGDVSLELANVTLQDSGEYTCYVSSDQNYGSASVALAVTETGGPPRLSAQWTDRGSVVNVSCGSEGWYPEPYLRWSDQNGALVPDSVRRDPPSTGLWSVHSWVLVRSSSEIICTVGLQGEEKKESKLHLKLPETGQRDSQNSASAIVGLAASAALLVVLTAVLGITFCQARGKARAKKITLRRKIAHLEEEKHRLLAKDMCTTKNHYVNVSVPIPESEHPHLMIKEIQNGYIVRDQLVFPKGSKVSCLTAITGRPGFSSGEHYWEVFMGQEHVGLKKSWWLGVTSVANVPADEASSPTPSQGYWFLSSSPEDPHFLQLSTEPAALIPLASRPQTVGVHLNYERGELTFYDVQSSSVVGRLKAKFEGEVFPFFNPGLLEQAPLNILHYVTTPSELAYEETAAV